MKEYYKFEGNPKDKPIRLDNNTALMVKIQNGVTRFRDMEFPRYEWIECESDLELGSLMQPLNKQVLGYKYVKRSVQ